MTLSKYWHIIFLYIVNTISAQQYFLTLFNTQQDNFSNSDLNALPEEDHQSIHNILKRLPVCEDDQLVTYLAEIQAINPESIVYMTTLDDLNLFCLKTKKNIAKIENYLSTCTIKEQNDLYYQLIQGVKTVHNMTCNDENPFKKQFSSHFSCFHDLHMEYESCIGPPDWSENTNGIETCRSYGDIADCYFVKTAKLCGIKAARLMKKLVLTVINSILTVKCENVKIDPIVADAMPDSGAISALGNIYNIIIYSSFIMVHYVLFII